MDEKKQFNHYLGKLILPVSNVKREFEINSFGFHWSDSLKVRKKMKDKLLTLLYSIVYINDCIHTRRLYTGEVCLSSGCLVYMLGNVAYYRAFMELFDKLAKKYPKKYCVRVACNDTGVELIKGYKIDLYAQTEMNEVKEDDPLYGKVSDMVGRYYEFLNKNRKKCSPEREDFYDNFYKYSADMDEANEICIKRNGISFKDAEEYLNSKDTFSYGDMTFIQCQAAHRDYNMLNALNNGNYHMKEAFGRVYGPFQSLPKEYRPALRYKKTGEKAVELIDMHGAFVKGTMAAVGCFAHSIGNDVVADKCMTIAVSKEDPYKFAMDSTHDRKMVKGPVLSHLFSTHAQRKVRETLYLNAFSSNADMKLAHRFLNFVDSPANKDLFNLDHKSLNSMLKEFSKETALADIIHASHDAKLVWRTTGNHLMNITNFVYQLRRYVDAYNSHYIMERFISYYGEDVYNMFDEFTKAIEDNLFFRTKMTLRRTIKELKPGRTPYSLTDIKNSLNLNSSIICQLAEGKLMFDKVLPYLKEKTGFDGFVTLHDAVWCPESVVGKVNTKELENFLIDNYTSCIADVFAKDFNLRKVISYYKFTHRIK